MAVGAGSLAGDVGGLDGGQARRATLAERRRAAPRPPRHPGPPPSLPHEPASDDYRCAGWCFQIRGWLGAVQGLEDPSPAAAPRHAAAYELLRLASIMAWDVLA